MDESVEQDLHSRDNPKSVSSKTVPSEADSRIPHRELCDNGNPHSLASSKGKQPRLDGREESQQTTPIFTATVGNVNVKKRGGWLSKWTIRGPNKLKNDGNNQRERSQPGEAVYTQEKEELTQLIGSIVVAASEDWALILHVCERASASEANAKEAIQALTTFLKGGKPKAQLGAAKLCAFMLSNSSDTFRGQAASQKFLGTLEELLVSRRTNPAVKGRVSDMFTAIAQTVGSDGNSRNRGPSRGRERFQEIVSPEEDIQLLFRECVIGNGLASLLSQTLEHMTPGDIFMDGESNAIAREFRVKCISSLELIAAQIPWASAGAERSRRELNSKRQAEGKPIAGEEGETTEETLLGDLLAANEELLKALTQYEDLERLAKEMKDGGESKNEVGGGAGRAEHERQLHEEKLYLSSNHSAPMGASTQSPNLNLGGAKSASGSPSSSQPVPLPPTPNTSGGDDDEELVEEYKPSEKAFGKRKIVVDEATSSNQSHPLGHLGANGRPMNDRFSVNYSDEDGSDSEGGYRGGDGGLGHKHPQVHYVYDAFAERAGRGENQGRIGAISVPGHGGA